MRVRDDAPDQPVIAFNWAEIPEWRGLVSKYAGARYGIWFDIGAMNRDELRALLAHELSHIELDNFPPKGTDMAVRDESERETDLWACARFDGVELSSFLHHDRWTEEAA